VTAEAASDEGLILGYWAATLRDMSKLFKGKSMGGNQGEERSASSWESP